MHSGKQMPSILYKYRTFSPYTIPMLSSQTVWYAIPNTLNDPFDCKATLIGLGADTRRALDWERQSRLAGVLLMGKRAIDSGKGFFGLSPAKTREVMDLLTGSQFSNLKIDGLVRAILDNAPIQTGQFRVEQHLNAVSRALDEVGVLSLSANSESMLLWTHYSDNHTGFALGFENPHINQDGLPADGAICAPVNYVNEFPELDVDSVQSQITWSPALDRADDPRVAVGIEDEAVKKVLLTKSDEWSYEYEWRCLRAQSGEAPAPGPLREIIFGLRCPQSIRNEIVGALSDELRINVEFKEVQICDGSFKLQVERM